MIVAGFDRDVAEWVEERSKYFTVPESKFIALGWANRDGKLVAGVVYDNFDRINIDMHIAGEGLWCDPVFFGECFRYPFGQLNVRRVTSRTAADNPTALLFVKAIGFRQEGRVRQALPGGVDLLILGMLKSECRWLEVGKRGINDQELRSGGGADVRRCAGATG